MTLQDAPQPSGRSLAYIPRLLWSSLPQRRPIWESVGQAPAWGSEYGWCHTGLGPVVVTGWGGGRSRAQTDGRIPHEPCRHLGCFPAVPGCCGIWETGAQTLTFSQGGPPGYGMGAQMIDTSAVEGDGLPVQSPSRPGARIRILSSARGEVVATCLVGDGGVRGSETTALSVLTLDQMCLLEGQPCPDLPGHLEAHAVFLPILSTLPTLIHVNHLQAVNVHPSSPACTPPCSNDLTEHKPHLLREAASATKDDAEHGAPLPSACHLTPDHGLLRWLLGVSPGLRTAHLGSKDQGQQPAPHKHIWQACLRPSCPPHPGAGSGDRARQGGHGYDKTMPL